MPVRIQDGVEYLGPLAVEPDVQKEDIEFWAQAIPAAFRLENTVNAVYRSMKDGIEYGVQNPDYDAWEDIPEDKRMYGEAYIDADSPEEVKIISERIDEENRAREILYKAGLEGTAATMIAAFIDPIVLVPVGGSTAKITRLTGNLLKGAYLTARAGFIGSSAAELALQHNSYTRTWQESVLNISAATFLSGVLGFAGASLGRRQMAKLNKLVEEDMSLKPIAGASGVDPDKIQLTAADMTNPNLTKEKLVKAFGIEKVTAWLKVNPILRVHVNSQSPSAKIFIQNLVETPFLLDKNLTGEATPFSVLRNMIQPYRGKQAEIVTTMKSEFVKYRQRVAGKVPKETGALRTRAKITGITVADKLMRREGKAMGWKKFKEEVGYAWAHGDEKAVANAYPEMQAVVKKGREVIDWLKERAQNTKDNEGNPLLGPDVHSTTSETWAPRIYRNQKLRRDEGNLYVERHITWILQKDAQRVAATKAARAAKKKLPPPGERGRGLTEEEAREIAKAIKERILGLSPNRMHYGAFDLQPGTPFHARTDDIPDAMIEPFLERDAEIMMDHLFNTMAPDIELTRKFGTTNFDEAISVPMPKVKVKKTTKAGKVVEKERKSKVHGRINVVTREYEQLMEGKSGKEMDKLSSQMNSDLRDLRALWEMVRGTWTAGEWSNPDAVLNRAGDVVRGVNYMALGGGFAMNSAPDMGRHVKVHGLHRTWANGIMPFIAHWNDTKIPRRELQLYGAVNEVVLDTRVNTMADVFDDYRPRSSAERGFKALTNNFSIINLLSLWNQVQKTIAGMIIHTRLIDAAMDFKTGKLKPRDMADMANLGFGLPELERLSAMASKYSQRKRFMWLSNTELWKEDMDIADKFWKAMGTSVDQVIVTANIGDRPLLMSTSLGKTIGQFKTFQFATLNRALIPAAQRARRGDMRILSGTALQVFLGMNVYAAKEKLGGRKVSTDPRKLIAEGIDRSGTLGIYTDMFNVVDRITRGTLTSYLTGGPILSRYASRNFTDVLVGPSLGRIQDIGTAIGAGVTADFSASDVRAMRRLTPYQNVFYMRWLFDMAERGINDTFHIPAKKPSKRKKR